MEQIKVSELASEFALQNTVVISELKKIGVWVPSADTPVDHDIASRIRRRLQLLVELEQEEHDKAEKKEKQKTAPPKAAKTKTIKQLGTVRKATKAEKAEEKPAEPIAAVPSSLRPRKGTKVYRKAEPEEQAALEKMEAAAAGAKAAAAEAEVVEEKPVEKVEPVAPALKAEAAAKLEAAEKAAGQEKPAVEKVERAAPERKPAEVRPLARAARPAEAPPTPGARVEPAPARLKQPARVLPSRERERARVLKKTSTAPTPVETTQISRRLVRPAPVEERAKKPVIRETPKAAPPVEKKKEAARAVAKAPEAPVARPRPPITEIRDVTLPEAVTVKDLSERLGVKSKDVLKELMTRGILATINHTLEPKLVEEICTTFGFIPHFVTFEEAILEEEKVEERAEDLAARAPVVTVMGHVDHGKTSLLDAIRETKVAAMEAGGITQHIGAYHVELRNRKIVFLDTPGHEAFTLMRARGAQATDIVVLVVAADDGVMPQTIEAINHARAAKVPILVAINKVDKPEAQPQRVMQQLSDHALLSEEWGGDTVMVKVSAKEKTNLDELLDMILLVADMLELKSNPKHLAAGVVLEAKLDRGRGVVATVLVQDGTLHVGDTFVAGAVFGKIRALFDDLGNPAVEAGPSSAVEVLGLQGIPQAGDAFQVVEDALKARQIVEYRQGKLREKEMDKSARLSLDQLYAKIQGGEVKELPIVLKADVQGSVEVLEDTLHKLSADKVKIRIIHSGVGAISESDVLLASTSNAIVIGFSVRPERNAQDLAEDEGVDIRLYTVIYDVAAEIRQAMLGLLEPTFRDKYFGKAEVRQTFRVPRVGTVAGCYVQDGVIPRNSEVRLLRDNVVIYEGKIDSLKRFKEDVGEVKAGYECGISIANFNDVKIGDVVEAFAKEKVEPQLT